MKGETKELKIINITWKEFKKLNLIGYTHRKVYYDARTNLPIDDPKELFEVIKDGEGTRHTVTKIPHYSKIDWHKVKLNDVVKGEIELSKENGWLGEICLAIHDEVTEGDIAEVLEAYPGLWNRKEALHFCLYGKSYLDKWITKTGHQTYLIRPNVKHLYSRRNHFYTKDEYFDIPKMSTKAVYLINFATEEK